MNTDTREPNAPESYATFWEPLPAPTPAPTSGAKDAYQEFVNVAEDAPLALRVERV
jgi:hypothetical protein